ncbi:MAG TPA: type II toxin-antitoxin system RelE/ParE family toxin, partial [Hanamia sp.]|nr:type II toxin-antitoxin system RelE/ParE family toxin [Hanamia sp.]
MKYLIEIKRSAQKQLAKISKPFSEAIYEKILALENNPRPTGCIKLTGREGWRIRVGDYRIVYEIKDNVLLIIVIDIDHRKQV